MRVHLLFRLSGKDSQQKHNHRRQRGICRSRAHPRNPAPMLHTVRHNSPPFHCEHSLISVAPTMPPARAPPLEVRRAYRKP
jgi:hypothetical protein